MVNYNLVQYRYNKVKSIVEPLAKKAHIPMPKIWVYNNTDLNAKALIIQNCIQINTGSIGKLTTSELHAMLAHEIGHFVEYQNGLAWTKYDRFWDDFTHRFGTLVIAITLSIFVLEPSLIMFIISIIISTFAIMANHAMFDALLRKHEYHADLIGAKLDGKYNSLQTMFVIGHSSNSHNKTLYEKLFSKHPSIDNRILHISKLHIA